MRKLLVVLIAVSLLGATPAHATVKSGAKCTKHKATSTVKGMKYTCIKSGNKLVWSKAVAVKPPADLKPGVCPPIAAADKDPGISQVRANTLVGMNEAQAEECAASLRWQFRVGQRDDEFFMLTKDFRVDRVTITVMQGLVTKVDIG
jgi:hypothetical protein